MQWKEMREYTQILTAQKWMILRNHSRNWKTNFMVCHENISNSKSQSYQQNFWITGYYYDGINYYIEIICKCTYAIYGKNRTQQDTFSK